MLENHTQEPVTLPLTLEFRSEFDDVLAVRGLLDPERGQLHPPREEGTSLVLEYDGVDDVRRSTRVELEPEPERWEDCRAEAELELGVGEPRSVRVTIQIGEERLGASGGEAESRDRPQGMLLSRQRGHHFYAAGVPWFVVLFGRDSMIAALQSLAFTPEIAAESLRCTSIRADDDGLIRDASSEDGKLINQSWKDAGDSWSTPRAELPGLPSRWSEDD